MISIRQRHEHKEEFHPHNTGDQTCRLNRTFDWVRDGDANLTSHTECAYYEGDPPTGPFWIFDYTTHWGWMTDGWQVGTNKCLDCNPPSTNTFSGPVPPVDTSGFLLEKVNVTTTDATLGDTETTDNYTKIDFFTGGPAGSTVVRAWRLNFSGTDRTSNAPITDYPDSLPLFSCAS